MQSCRKTLHKKKGKTLQMYNNNNMLKIKNFSILCLALAKIKWKVQLTYEKLASALRYNFLFSLVFFESSVYIYIQYICNFCGLRNCISALSMLRLRFQAQYLNNSISILNITSKYAFPHHFKGIAVETYIFAISKWQDMHTANMTVWSALKHHYAQPKIPFKWFSSICEHFGNLQYEKNFHFMHMG